MRLRGWTRDMPIRAIDPEEQEDNEPHDENMACECEACSRARWQRMEREDAEHEVGDGREIIGGMSK